MEMTLESCNIELAMLHTFFYRGVVKDLYFIFYLPTSGFLSMHIAII